MTEKGLVEDSHDLRQAAQAINQQIDRVEKLRGRGKVGWRRGYAVLQHEAEMEKTNQALTDPLTGLYNRRAFLLLAGNSFKIAQREGFPTCVLFMDIDFFKRINDQYGHEGGDLVLKAIGRLLNPEKKKALIRIVDLVSRWGGEEIVFFLENTDIDGARKVAEKIKDKMAKTLVKINDKGTASFTVSIGAAQIGEGETLEALIGRADQAMYKAKARGRNRVEVFTEENS